MALLGYFYENGLGTLKNLTAARDWYEKSADRGNTFAKNRLNQLPAQAKR
jgi:TPR repeat protein